MTEKGWATKVGVVVGGVTGTKETVQVANKRDLEYEDLRREEGGREQMKKGGGGRAGGRSREGGREGGIKGDNSY